MITYLTELIAKFRDPWVWFGFGAQGLFFFRFFWQWVVSERRKRSMIPLAFWYFSIAGAVCTFIYAAKRQEPVFMLPQFVACFFYVRNLMLIHGEDKRRRLAGLPPASSTESETQAAHQPAVQEPDSDVSIGTWGG